MPLQVTILLRPFGVKALNCNTTFIVPSYRAQLHWRGSMDLNYLFYRQQVERSRSNSANSELARKAHEELAMEYERQIEKAANSPPSGDGQAGTSGSLENSELNPTMALAITARSVGGR